MACIVYYLHKVLPLKGTSERGAVDRDRFAAQLKWLRRLGVSFVPLKTVAAWLEGKQRLPRLSAALTFDDGYASVAEEAHAILNELSIPYTLFVVSRLLGEESNFYAQKGGKPARHMTVEEIKELLATGLIEVGAHGRTHRNLNELCGRELREEIQGSKEELERLLAVPVPYFAYPGGAVSPEAKEMVHRAGFVAAFGTQKRALKDPERLDRYALPRVSWSRRTTVFKLLRPYLFS